MSIWGTTRLPLKFPGWENWRPLSKLPPGAREQVASGDPKPFSQCLGLGQHSLELRMTRDQSL